MSTATSPVAGREFEFSSADFDRIRKLIYDHAGINIAAGKQEMVYSRLARRVRALGLTRFSDYLARLAAGDAAEWEAFTNALTTNLTSFFREPHHFPMLADAARDWIRTRRQVTIWCAAASTGEEPYSIAMTMVEALGRFDAPVRIIASDVDTGVLAKAEAGVYGVDRLDRVDAERVRRFFLKGSGANAGQVRVRDELKRMIVFRRINLLEAKWPVGAPIDAIFCRNVMIYFDKPTQNGILRRFAPLLAPDGLLFAGHSESLLHTGEAFRLRGRTVYELAAPARR